MDKKFLPKDRRTLNAWSRYYYSVHPDIAIFLDEIATQVCGSFYIRRGDGLVTEDIDTINKAFFEKKQFRGLSKCVDLVREWNLIGEVIPYFEVNENSGSIDFTLLNQDHVEIKNNSLRNSKDFFLIPDDELKGLIRSKKKEDIKLVKSLGKDIQDYIKKNKNIPLNPNYVQHILTKSSPYDLRGTSRIAKYFKTLLTEDKIREVYYENGQKPKGDKLISEVLKRECKTETFRNSLTYQREVLKEFLEGMFERYRKVNGLKDSVCVVWEKPIDFEKFNEIWK